MCQVLFHFILGQPSQESVTPTFQRRTEVQRGQGPCLRSHSRFLEQQAEPVLVPLDQQPAFLILSRMWCQSLAQPLCTWKSQGSLNSLTEPGTVHYVVSNSCDSSFKMKVFVPIHKELRLQELGQGHTTGKR